ncbi:cell division protein ZapA [Sphingomonas bacterium]|uniref:cell division protein ZapA n=1 Tax=Sphingomonas bacterium TaxID=1895847 RepID=UPI0015757C6C|nr:cell division protein ZapA [Sphingomonas bacterium]
MAEVMLSIGGRGHPVGCRDGEEARLRELGAILDERWAMAQRAAGNGGGERAMLFVALMLADDLDEARNRPPAGASVGDSALRQIAERLEKMADALEQSSLEQSSPNA